MSEFKEQETRQLLLESLKKLGSYRRITTGHGESSNALCFLEDYGQLDKLLDLMVDRERQIYNTLASHKDWNAGLEKAISLIEEIENHPDCEYPTTAWLSQLVTNLDANKIVPSPVTIQTP